MIGRAAVLGMTTLCAMAFSAIVAQGATAHGTTAFRCTEESAEVGFADAHCENAATGSEVKFAHDELNPGTSFPFKQSNEKTAEETKAAAPTTFRWTALGILTEVVCAGVSGSGTIVNTTTGEAMQATGSSTTSYASCVVAKPVGNCKVKEPIIQTAVFATYEAEGEMGVELTPKEKGTFASILIEGCALEGTFKLKGSEQGTPAGSPEGAGATLKFTEGMGALSIGGQPVTLESTVTQEISGFGLQKGAVAFTTTEK